MERADGACGMTRALVARGRGLRRGRGGADSPRGGGAGGAEGGRRGARGRGGPGVLWDAAVEWRWARDFEQTRVCVSEAPPPPRQLGAQGARREEKAAAPPALVSVRPGGGGIWAGGREGAPAPAAAGGGAAEGRLTAPSGSRGWWWVGGGGEREPAGWRGGGGRGVAVPHPRAAVGGRILPGSAPSRPHPGGRLSPGLPPALPGGSGGRARAAVDSTLRGPGRRPCGPRLSGNRFCCCVIWSRRPLLSPPPAAPLCLRPFVRCLRVCVRFPREAHQPNVTMSPRCTGDGSGPGLSLARQR